MHIWMAQHGGNTVRLQHVCVWCTEITCIAKIEMLDYQKAFSSATESFVVVLLQPVLSVFSFVLTEFCVICSFLTNQNRKLSHNLQICADIMTANVKNLRCTNSMACRDFGFPGMDVCI